MPIYKRCSRCGGRILVGQGCPCRDNRHSEYDRFSRDARSKAFYNSKEWLDAKHSALRADGGLDVYMYMTTGQIIAADTVHHIVPLRDDWTKRNSLDNLISLSGPTHSRIEQEYRKNKYNMIRKLTEMAAQFRETQRVGGI